MLPETVPASPPRARRVALLPVGARLLLAAGGALGVLQFAPPGRRGPGAHPPRPAPPRQPLPRGERGTPKSPLRAAGGGDWPSPPRGSPPPPPPPPLHTGPTV